MDSSARTKADSGAVISEEQAQQWAAQAASAGQPRPRILTGDRTTGKLHLGHYVGSLKHRVKYQGLYDTYILMADVQALTTHYDRPEILKEAVREVLLDYLAAGLDPYMGGEDDGSKVKIVVQSMVPSIAELTVFYGLLVPVRSLYDNPTFKTEAEQYGFTLNPQEGVFRELMNQGGSMLGYLELSPLFVEVLAPLFPTIEALTYSELRDAVNEMFQSPKVSIQATIAEIGGKEGLGPPDQMRFLLESRQELRREIESIMVAARRKRGLLAIPYGFLGYPVSQAADITFIGAQLVPVGPDQVPLIELCREVVHRFNSQYGAAPTSPSSGAVTGADSSGTEAAATGSGVLTTPFALLGVREALPGLDGNLKMGKSLGNAINLSETDEEIWAKVKVAPTDPQRMRRTDPGRPEVCNIFSYHKVFNGEKEPAIDEAALGVLSVEETAQQCRTAGIGCVDCKKNLCAKLKAILDPMRERRAAWAARPGDLEAVLRAGTARANEEGEKTLARVKAAMHMDYFSR